MPTSRSPLLPVHLCKTFLTIGCLLASGVALAAEDTPTVRIHSEQFVQDSAIAASIKAQLAVDHITRVEHIQVDSDRHGVVWLSGTARTEEAIAHAIAMTRATEGVHALQSDIRLLGDD